MAQFYQIKVCKGRQIDYLLVALFAIFTLYFAVKSQEIVIIWSLVPAAFLIALAFFIRKALNKGRAKLFYLKLHLTQATLIYQTNQYRILPHSFYLFNWIFIRSDKAAWLFAPDMLDKQAQSRLRRTIKSLQQRR